MRKAFLDCEESFPRSGEPLYDGLDRQKRACTIPPFAVPVPRFYCTSPLPSWRFHSPFLCYERRYPLAEQIQ